MSIGIIIKGGATHRQDNRGLQDLNKDRVHNRRKLVEAELRKTVFSRDKMWQTDCHDKDQEAKRVNDYRKWQKTKTGLGKTNEQLMSEWGDLNRDFKRRGDEGKPQCIDFVRQRKTTKYE